MAASASSSTSMRVTRKEDAELIVMSAIKALDILEPLIEEETRLFRAGKVKNALAFGIEKNQAAQEYALCLEILKNNTIALGRFKPEKLETLRIRHQEFAVKMQENLAAVTMARSVSENLLRELADVVGKNAGPKTYCRGKIQKKMSTVPLTLSRIS